MTGEPVRKLAVLVHADVVGSTSLVRLDETLAHARFQDVFRRFSESIVRHDGITHEIRGDALIAEFSKASDAVSAAAEFQNANREYNRSLEDELRPQLRIGIAMGEVVIADNTVTGEGIVLAQRLEQLAMADGICIQGAVRDTLPRRLAGDLENLGDQSVKGFDEPVRAYAINPEAGRQSNPQNEANADFGTRLELPSKPSIAVLPLNNMSKDSEDEFFADGISEDIITELSKFRNFFVIARNSSFSFKDEALTIKEIGARLGVRYVVEGSVRKAGSRVRITAQLIDAIEDNHLWAERYDRDLEDIFAVQDEVTKAIVTAIEPQLASSERQRARRKPTASLDAWECYQRGLGYMFTYSHTSETLEFFQRAIDLDPEFSSAYAGIAYACAIRILIGESTDKQKDLQRGITAAEAGIEVDPTDPFVFFAQGRILIFGGEHDKAINAFQRAISLNPNYALAHFGLGHGYWHAGQPDKSVPLLEEAIRLSPHDPILWAFLASKAIALVMVGDYEEGIAFSREAQKEHGTLKQRSIIFSHLGEVSGLGLLEKSDEAAEALHRLKAVFPEITQKAIQEAIPMVESEGKQRLFEGLKLAGLS